MKYRKKSIEIEAIQYRVVKEIPCKYGIHKETNEMEVAQFMNHSLCSTNGKLIIPTLEGNMEASIGDYIIKEPFATDDRKFYPCKPDIFEKTYERVE